MRKSCELIIISIFLVFVLAVWLLFLALPQPAEVSPHGQQGTIDLADVDFANDIVSILHLNWDSYPGALYTPDDFAAGVPAEPRAFDIEDYRRNEVATHRLKLRLPG